MGDLHIVGKDAVDELSWVETVLIGRKEMYESALRFEDEPYRIRNTGAKLEEINYLLGVVEQMINDANTMPKAE